MKKKERTTPVAKPVTEPRFYARIRGVENGPFRVPMLRKIPGFTLQTEVRLDGTDKWNPAFEVIDLKAYFWTAPPPASLGTPFEKSGLHAMLNALETSDKPTNENSTPA